MRIPIILMGSDVDVWVNGLHVDGSAAYDNAASGYVQVLDGSGNQLAGTINYAFAYQAASNGNYLATIPNSVALTEDDEYFVQTVITGSSGAMLVKRTRVRAGYAS